MIPIVVTTGQRFIDLDALASVIAYCEIDPIKYIPVIPGPLNHSITQTIKKWGFKYETKPPKEVDGYIVMDVSEDKFIANFVEIKKVIEIYDHHHGFEAIWQARTKTKSTIVEIGACATLVWEEIKKQKTKSNQPASQGERGEQTTIKISPTSANLLYTAIITHTLNFKISITKDRDRQAAQELKQYCSLPENWIPEYYREIEQDVYRDPVFAIANDTKIAYVSGQSMAIGTIDMWLPEDFIKENKNTIRSALKEFDTELWLYSSPCISKGINYLLTDSQTVKEWLKMYIGATFDKNSDLGTTSRLWLRKEILRELEGK